MTSPSAKHPQSFAWRLRSAFFKQFISADQCADISIIAEKIGKPIASRILWALRSQAADIRALKAKIAQLEAKAGLDHGDPDHG